MAIDFKALTPRAALGDIVSGDMADVGAQGVPVAPPRRSRANSIQRLQIGLTGLGAILLVIAVAGIIKDRVDETEATIVADAGEAPPVEAEPQNDALVDAGLVPDLPAEPTPTVAPDGAQPQATAPAAGNTVDDPAQ